MARVKKKGKPPPDAEEVAMNWIVKVAKSLVQALTDPYRPELHYMRGPGPKWRAKHSEPVRIVAGV